MRAILDTNIFVSYLLSKRADAVVVIHIVESAYLNVFELLLPEEQIRELRTAVVAKPYLRARISDQEVDELIRA
jgi:predicted nucleic acid-binding protein